MATHLTIHLLHSSLTRDHVCAHLVRHVILLHHLADIDARMLALKHGTLGTEVSHRHGILHRTARSRSACIWRHVRYHRTLCHLWTGHTMMHRSHHSGIWLTHVSSMLHLHGMPVCHTRVARTHAGLSGVGTRLHHVCNCLCTRALPSNPDVNDGQDTSAAEVCRVQARRTCERLRSRAVATVSLRGVALVYQ